MYRPLPSLHHTSLLTSIPLHKPKLPPYLPQIRSHRVPPRVSVVTTLGRGLRGEGGGVCCHGDHSAPAGVVVKATAPAGGDGAMGSPPDPPGGEGVGGVKEGLRKGSLVVRGLEGVVLVGGGSLQVPPRTSVSEWGTLENLGLKNGNVFRCKNQMNGQHWKNQSEKKPMFFLVKTQVTVQYPLYPCYTSGGLFCSY